MPRSACPRSAILLSALRSLHLISAFNFQLSAFLPSLLFQLSTFNFQLFFLASLTRKIRTGSTPHSPLCGLHLQLRGSSPSGLRIASVTRKIRTGDCAEYPLRHLTSNSEHKSNTNAERRTSNAEQKMNTNIERRTSNRR